MDDVRLKNQTARPHNFMMMVTSPFVGPDKLHGICGANDIVTISELSNDDVVKQHNSKLPLEGFVVVRGESAVASSSPSNQTIILTTSVQIISQKPLFAS